MKFIVRRTSRKKVESPIEINTLEELLKFLDKVGEPIIIDEEINFRTAEKEGYLLEIYDDYRE